MTERSNEKGLIAGIIAVGIILLATVLTSVLGARRTYPEIPEGNTRTSVPEDNTPKIKAVEENRAKNTSKSNNLQAAENTPSPTPEEEPKQPSFNSNTEAIGEETLDIRVGTPRLPLDLPTRSEERGFVDRVETEKTGAARQR